MLRVFIGYDKRQPLAFNVCRSSIERRASRRVQIEPLMLDWMPVKRRGLTDFTYSRYLVPYLCGYVGDALFLDPDMIVLDDIFNLLKHYDNRNPVSVVKSPLRFEWPSLMLFNNARCKELTLEVVGCGSPQKFDWASQVGELPKEWNHCVGYDAPNPEAKIIHYTKGIPCWPETQDCEFAKEWHKEALYAMGSVSWRELMGNSVHAKTMKKEVAPAS